MKLTDEKVKELREVKECCKVSLPEFTEKYNKLDIIGKVTIYQTIVDEDYDFNENEETDEKLNEEILKFLRQDKKVGQLILDSLRGDIDPTIKDNDGNEYEIYELYLSSINENDETDF